MHIAQNWRIRQSRYAMVGARCAQCGTILFPARATCPHCTANARIDRQAVVDSTTQESINVNPALVIDGQSDSPWAQAAR